MRSQHHGRSKGTPAAGEPRAKGNRDGNGNGFFRPTRPRSPGLEVQCSQSGLGVFKTEKSGIRPMTAQK